MKNKSKGNTIIKPHDFNSQTNNLVLDKDAFEVVGKNLSEAQKLTRPSMSYLEDAFRRIRKNKPAILSFCILVILIVMSIIGPIISKKLYDHDYSKQNLSVQNQTFIVSNQRSLKLSSNSVFKYEKYKPNLRKTELSFNSVTLNKAGGKLSFIVGDKSEESFQGDEKEYKLEVKIDANSDWNTVLAKLNDASSKLLSEDHNFRGVSFKKSGNNLKIETVGVKKFNNKYWFGTDVFGRDLFTRLWEGGRVSFLIAFVSVFFTVLLGIVYGGVSGYIGGRADTIMMRVIEVLMVVPDMLYILLLLTVLKPGLFPIIIVMAATSWMGTARLVRGEVLRLKNSEYVIAAQILGASSEKIIFRHLIPNAMGPILVNMTMMIPHMIFAEAFLSFIGLGVPAPFASWGVLVNEGARVFTQFPHLLIIPGIAISLTMLAFNILGDGLRDALDPKLRK